MTVIHGKNTRVYVEGYDLSNKFDAVSNEVDITEHETTGFGVDSKTYMAGLVDARLTAEGFWDTDTSNNNLTDDVLSAELAAGDSVWCVMYADTAVGDRGLGIQAIQSSYGQTSKVSEVTRVKADAQSQVAFDAIQTLHVKAQRTTDGNGSSLDNGTSSSNGGVGYLQVFSATGGNAITVKIQHSTNDIDWNDLITFTAATGITAERVTTTGTVNRYVRAAWTHETPPGAATFFVGFGRK